jgi:uncharacterized protein
MLLELEAVFNTQGASLPFSYALTGFEGVLPLAAPPLAHGEVRNRAGVVTLAGKAALRLDTQCDRCAAPFEYAADVPFEHTLVTSLNDGDNDELVLVESSRWSPDGLLWEDIVLSLPSKLLCRPDCEGLCPRCGQNLNEAPCACAPEDNPRWAALKNLTSDIETS